jgi:hypothetical protein
LLDTSEARTREPALARVLRPVTATASRPPLLGLARPSANIRSVTPDGSPSARFERALRTGNLLLVRAAAAELAQVNLADALRILTLYAEKAPEQYERAALRWLSRFALEVKTATLPDAGEVVDALDLMRHDRPAAVEELRALMWGRRQPREGP